MRKEEGPFIRECVARRLARDLGMHPFELPGPATAADRATYHAAAALVSNDLLALLATGADLLESLGLSRATAIRALAPLASGTLRQAAGAGPAAALTGPVVRGDHRTLSGHLRRLSPPAREIHRLLSRRLLQLAEDEGRGLPPDARRRIQAVLGGRGKRSGV